MGTDSQKVEALNLEIERLHWRISTLEAAETECARAVSALAESEARYRRLLDDAGFPITISNAEDSTILYANPLACQLFGLICPVPQGRRMLEFYPKPSDRAGLLKQLRAQGAIRGLEVIMLDGKGQSLNVIIAASLVSFEGQEAVLATSNDITARRHAEALFHTIVEASPDGFAVADLDGRLTYISPHALQLFGYGPGANLLGHNLREFIPPQEQAQVEGNLRALLNGEVTGPSEWTGIHQDGSTFPQETNGGLLKNADGSPHAFFFIVRDLSNRKHLERAIRWGKKLESLGLMAAGIAHELNNAFQITQGHLEVALGLCPNNPDLEGALSQVGGGVDRATALAREMLNYSGRTLREEGPLDLDQVVEESLIFLREFLTSEARLEFLPGKEPHTVQADGGQIMKVVTALALNAIEAIEGQGGLVQIRTGLKELTAEELTHGFWPASGREGRFLQLEVLDSGVGISPDRLERVCDPFYTTKGHGRGLGLSAALGILRAHSACLQILSRPGKGTTVRAFFPISIHAPSLPLPETSTNPIPSGILVAEDDDLIRELVVRLLLKWGFAPVWEAPNGADALELFHRHRDAIGIFLTDATMPRMSGPEAFEAMRKLNPALRGILMTGYSEAFGEGTAAAFGFSDFLNKPFRQNHLQACLEGVRSGTTPASKK